MYRALSHCRWIVSKVGMCVVRLLRDVAVERESVRLWSVKAPTEDLKSGSLNLWSPGHTR
jgi:hypothetical protein